MNLFLLPDSSTAPRQVGKCWDKFASSLSCCGFVLVDVPSHASASTSPATKQKKSQRQLERLKLMICCDRFWQWPVASCCQERRKTKKVRGRQKEIWSIVSVIMQSGLLVFPWDLVKCFYDHAILPAGDVQGNENQGPKGRWAVASRVAGEKKSCPTVRFVHSCFKFLL